MADQVTPTVEKKAEKTITAFCAACQEEKKHVVTVDDHGEYIISCDCKRFIKVPSTADVKEYLAAHKDSNEGQITEEEIAAAKAELLAKI
jgi:hypothetical protein